MQLDAIPQNLSEDATIGTQQFGGASGKAREEGGKLAAMRSFDGEIHQLAGNLIGSAARSL
jgi:hypothetical protein